MSVRTISWLLFFLSSAGLAQTPTPPLREVFRKVKPSVVVVQTVGKEAASLGRPGLVQTRGLGSGVLIAKDGKIITAAHVVQAADEIVVQFPDEDPIPARVIASSSPVGVALLQLQWVPASAVVAPLGNSDRMEVGDDVFVVGSPYGISYTLTVGHISGRHKLNLVTGSLRAMELFQTDAAINRGQSGGPMFNMSGEVVGIVSHILSQSGGFEGLGFAVTAKVVEQLLLEPNAFWSGMEGYWLTEDLAKVLNVPQPGGILVQRIVPGSPAERLGLRASTVRVVLDDEPMRVGGDVILEVAGIPISDADTTYEKVQAVLSKMAPGDKVMVKVLREGRVVELTYHRAHGAPGPSGDSGGVPQSQ